MMCADGWTFALGTHLRYEMSHLQLVSEYLLAVKMGEADSDFDCWHDYNATMTTGTILQKACTPVNNRISRGRRRRRCRRRLERVTRRDATFVRAVDERTSKCETFLLNIRRDGGKMSFTKHRVNGLRVTRLHRKKELIFRPEFFAMFFYYNFSHPRREATALASACGG